MDEQRKTFEAWATPRGYHIATWNDGGYYDDATNEVWMAWGAATAAERERCAKLADSRDPAVRSLTAEAIRKG